MKLVEQNLINTKGLYFHTCIVKCVFFYEVVEGVVPPVTPEDFLQPTHPNANLPMVTVISVMPYSTKTQSLFGLRLYVPANKFQ